MIVNKMVKNEWYVTSIFDFISQFGAEDWFKKHYDWDDEIDSISLESKGFTCDGDVIQSYLKQDKRKFEIRFFEENDGYWIIEEVEE